MTPVHITKRALVDAQGECAKQESQANICDGSPDGGAITFNLLANYHLVTCPACLVLLDAELEGRGAEAQRRRAEIEAGR